VNSRRNDVLTVVPLRVDITKRRDGSAVLRCTRADGSVTWQRQDGHQARFFPLHDLTHLAVEAGIGARAGFFGLIARGWDISETTGKGARGNLPVEALFVECLVSIIERGEIGRAPLDVDEVNEQMVRLVVEGQTSITMPLTADQLRHIHERRDAFHEQWAILAEDGTLSLTFPPDDTSG